MSAAGENAATIRAWTTRLQSCVYELLAFEESFRKKFAAKAAVGLVTLPATAVHDYVSEMILSVATAFQPFRELEDILEREKAGTMKTKDGPLPPDGPDGPAGFWFNGQHVTNLTTDEAKLLECLIVKKLTPTWTEAVLLLWPGNLTIKNEVSMTRGEWDQVLLRLNRKLRAARWREVVRPLGRTTTKPGKLTLALPQKRKAKPQAKRSAKTRAR